MIVPLTPLDFKRRAVKLYRTKVAVVDGEKQFTYGEFSARTNQLSHGLRSLGVERGTKVAVLAPNTHEMLECFYGVPQLGGILVPINIRLQSHEIKYIILHSDAEVLIIDSEFADKVDEVLSALGTLRHIILIESGYKTSLPFSVTYETLLQGQPQNDIRVEVDENSPITINYTSGTTSRPKGVVLTHRNTYVNAADFLLHLRVFHDDVYLHTLPMFHVNGWGGVWAITAVGGTHICLRRVDPALILSLYEQEHITLACGAPTVLNMLIQSPNLKDTTITWPTRIATAGSPPPAAIIQQVQKFLNMEVIHVYGSTEVSPFISICEWRDEFNRLDDSAQAALKAYQGVEMVFSGETSVVRTDGTEVAWDGMEIGEIVARGNVVMDGYYKQPEETDKCIRDGWFHTGDLAKVYQNGYIEIVDRLKDVIISGGENVSSIEVEGYLYKHPAVADVAVVAKPDEKWGEVPVALIVLKPGMSATAQELNEFCRSGLAHFKVPKEFRFVDVLPRTSTGKLQKYVIRQPFWEGKEKHVQ